MYMPLHSYSVFFCSAVVAEDVGTEERVITSWHNITVGPRWFRKYAMDYVTRGSRVIVDGSLSYHKSTLPDGSVKVSANVRASKFFSRSLSFF